MYSSSFDDFELLTDKDRERIDKVQYKRRIELLNKRTPVRGRKKGRKILN